MLFGELTDAFGIEHAGQEVANFGGLAGTQQERHRDAMAFDTSESKALTILHRATVTEYVTWSLIVSCQRCGVVRTIQLATLPPKLTILQALVRMRCRNCRAQVSAAVLDNNVPEWRGRTIQVWGPGAYR